MKRRHTDTRISNMKIFPLIVIMLAVVLSVLALVYGLYETSSKTCNDNSIAACVGEHVGTECGELPGRGFTCTEVSGGSILRPQCGCEQ